MSNRKRAATRSTHGRPARLRARRMALRKFRARGPRPQMVVQSPGNPVRNITLALVLTTVGVGLGRVTLLRAAIPPRVAERQPAALALPAAPVQAALKAEDFSMRPEFAEAARYGFGGKIAYWSRFVSDEHRAGPRLRNLVNSQAQGQRERDLLSTATYVETVAALARSQEPAQYTQRLLAIRALRGKMATQDLTSALARNFGIPLRSETPGAHRRVDYISLADLPMIADHVPNGTLVNVVHKGDERRHAISPLLGYAVRERGAVFLRYATAEGKIRTIELGAYLRSLVRDEDPQSAWSPRGRQLQPPNS